MVNTRQSTPEFLGPAFDEAVQRAVNALLPGLTTQITNEIRQNGAGSSGEQPPTIHTWLEWFGKQKPRSFSFATTLVDAENWIAHIEKLFEVLGCADAFKDRLASYKLEGDALSWWKAYLPRSEQQKYEREYHTIRQRDGEPSGEFMKRFLRLAGFLGKKAVANAARNIKIFRERSSQNNKRNRDGDRIRPTAQDSKQRGYDQKGDDGRGHDRMATVIRSPVMTEISFWVFRVTGACFSCGSTGHMARDCPKNAGNGGEGSGNDKQAATKGRVFDSTTNHAASASGSVWMHPRSIHVSCLDICLSSWAFLCLFCNLIPLIILDFYSLHYIRMTVVWQKIGRKITINGSDKAGYDKSKVKCFNCHKLGHFTRECKGSGNQNSKNRNQDSSRRTINVEETSSKAMLAIDGASFDWSYMADDEFPTNMALMAFLDSEVHNDKTCSKTYLKSFETLKTQLDDLRIELNKSEFNLATYKRGLASVEEQLVFYKKNEVIFYEQLAVLKRDISYKDSEISMLKSELEKLKQEKDSNQLKIENFDNASKSLDKLIWSQITDNSRKGVGFVSYNVVLPPHTGEDTSNEVRESPDAPLVKKLMSDDKLEKKTIFPTVSKIEFVRPKQQEKPGHPQKEDQGYVDSGCSRYMTWNMSYLLDFKEFDRGYVTFGGGAKGGKITGKGTLKTGKLDFEDVYFVKELQFNLFSVLLKVPRKNNMYSVDMKNIVPKECLTCLVAKATLDESMLWHRRLGHVNFKTINKLVKENLVRGLPSKRFENDQTCVACLKGKQHKASCKSKIQNSITQPLFMLHMDLFGLTFVSSLMNKKYYLVVTDDYSRFTWVFFLATKDETSGILKSFITEIENLVDKKVKIIRCDNGTEFKNRVMSEFCEQKGIKREFSVARTPQQNGVAERRNRTLIKAAKTMLVDSKLPTIFCAEAVNTACYVQNRVLAVKPHHKTPYELFRGRTPALSFMRPFGYHVTILNTLDYKGKFDGKSDEGFFVVYCQNGQNRAPGTNSNDSVDGLLFDSSLKNASNDEPQPSSDAGKKDDEGVCKENGIVDQEKSENSTQGVNTAGPSINTEPDMFSLEDNATATHADFFGDETEVDMSNITTTYPIPST
ncbi:putative ribonuclease H-like domain-containing protein [Tanacetum coccineum]